MLNIDKKTNMGQPGINAPSEYSMFGSPNRPTTLPGQQPMGNFGNWSQMSQLNQMGGSSSGAGTLGSQGPQGGLPFPESAMEGGLGLSMNNSMLPQGAYGSQPPQQQLTQQLSMPGMQVSGMYGGSMGSGNTGMDDYDDMDDGYGGGSGGGTGQGGDTPLCPPGNEHTGRWTRQEHELFLEALAKYGKVLCLVSFSFLL
jgi:hypothetical protein